MILSLDKCEGLLNSSHQLKIVTCFPLPGVRHDRLQSPGLGGPSDPLS